MTPAIKPTMAPANYRQADGRGKRFQLVGVLPDGREVVIEWGRRDEVERSHALVHNCGTYSQVVVRDLNPSLGVDK